MRVLHVIPALGASYGGPSAAMRGMAAALARHGATVEVATTNANGRADVDLPLGVPLRDDGVTYRYFGRHGRSEWKPSLGLTRWLSAHVGSYDVVAVHGLFACSTLAACRLAHHSRVPYVLRPLGMLTEWSLARRSWKKRPYLALLERTHLERAAAIHVTSTVEASAARALGLRNLALVGLGVSAPGPGARPAFEESHPPLRVLSLCRLHPGKGIELLIDACALSERRAPGEIELTIAGDGEPAYRAALVERVHRASLTGRVRFVGHLDDAGKEDAFAKAELFVLASSSENFGLSVAEALARGVPVVISGDVGIAPEVARAGAGLVIERTPAAIASAMLRLGNDRALRQRLGAAARELARTRFTWEACARELLRLYERVAADARARRLATRLAPELDGEGAR